MQALFSFIARLGISAATYRARHVWWGRLLLPVINAMFRDAEHCAKAHRKGQVK
jgi:hypothetical protein